MQSSTTRVLAAVVDTNNLILYKEDGTTIEIPQGDARIRPILNAAVPQLINQGYADIAIESAVPQIQEYADFEKASNGVVRLFKVAKSKLTGLFKKKEAPIEADTVGPISVGTIPAALPASVTEEVRVHTAIEDILQHAVPVSSPSFTEADVAKQGNVVEKDGLTIKAHGSGDEPDTIIAVMDNKIIPGVEKIKSQFGRAAASGSTKGMEAFLQRLGAVIQDRSHSVEDLLKFMERGDLPIADDGCILIYKVLRKANGGTKYVDCHTQQVEQWVGAFVCMDPSLVDHNRNNECSNGLHVARRGYVREFSGDVCVLAKLAPEDVIAVPTYDANKMRVCGYHIIAELSPEMYRLLNQNKPITEIEGGKVLLGKAIAGQHIGKTHEVRITGHRGTGVQVTKLGSKKIQEKGEVAPAEAITNPGEAPKAAPLDPKEVVKEVTTLTRKEKAAQLYADYRAKKPGALEALLAYKKAAKVSWEKLGLPDPGDVLGTVANTKEAPKPVAITPQMISDAADAIEEFGEDELERFRDEQEAKKAEKRTINGVVLGEGSFRERIQKLLAIGVTSVGVAKAVLELKKKSKKSWTTLGVSDAQVEQIIKLAQ
ncbi:MAG: hypothetical protein KC496_01780 [Anaerolineae bacterium]|nr:hypothetical protein [Anaerolineae bacterium]